MYLESSLALLVYLVEKAPEVFHGKHFRSSHSLPFLEAFQETVRFLGQVQQQELLTPRALSPREFTRVIQLCFTHSPD